MTHEPNNPGTEKRLAEMRRFLARLGPIIPAGGCAVLALLETEGHVSAVGAFATTPGALAAIGAPAARARLADDVRASFNEATRLVGGEARGAPTDADIDAVLALARAAPPPGTFWLLTFTWSLSGFSSCRCDAVRPDASGSFDTTRAN